MKYQLVFSPRLGLSPKEFARDWNQEPEMQAIAQAQIAANVQRAYNVPVVETVWLLVSTIGMGLATNALYDLVKKAVARHKPQKRIKLTTLDQPDGTHLLIFEEEDM